MAATSAKVQSPLLVRSAFRFGAVLLCLYAALLAACEETSTRADAPPPSLATMPRAPEPIASTQPGGAMSIDAPPLLESGDAGPQLDDSPHAILLSACAIDRSGCRHAQPGSPPDGSSYRVALGRGPGSVRSRTQAMADLYKELRDRMQLNQHLVAEVHRLGDSVTQKDDPKLASRAGGQVADDPIVEAAFQLMQEVEHEGAVTIDTVSGRGTYACKLSLGVGGGDGGASRCLVEAPPRPEARPGLGH